MSTYIIGDIHGCYATLRSLIEKLAFDPANDKLWFVGDLINRGPASLDTLRFIKSLGDRAVVTLGNHDLHCIGVYYDVRKPSAKDTLDDILKAPDADQLIDWLRHRPLLHHDKALNTVMVHAGIPPMWSLKTAKKQAKKLEKALRCDDLGDCLPLLFGNSPEHWNHADTPRRRRRFAANAFTRMRYCWDDGSLDFSSNVQPATRPEGLSAWYKTPKRVPIDETIVFGHWAAHPSMAPAGIVPLDRGCVYGGSLAAYIVEEKRCVWVDQRRSGTSN